MQILFDFELRFGELKGKALFDSWENYKSFACVVADEAGGQTLEGFSEWNTDILPFLNFLQLLPSTAAGRDTKRAKVNKSVDSFITFEEVI